MAANSIPLPEAMRVSGDVSSNWDNFRAEFEDYSLATGLNEKPAAVQAATLRRVMGSECLHVYKHNLNLTEEQKSDTKTILDALEAFFRPSKNVIYERYIFGCCKQEDCESIDRFVTRLREKAASCEYGSLRDELIRDKIVLGITSESTRRHLLRKHDLDLQTAIEICRTAELTDKHMKAMEQDKLIDNINAASKQQQSFKNHQHKFQHKGHLHNSPGRKPASCKYCGNVHVREKEKCPAYGKICTACGKPNHFARVCLSSKMEARKLHTIEQMSDPEDAHLLSTDMVYSSECIGAVNTKGKKWFVNLRLNNIIQPCQLDSGATCDVMSIKDKMKLAPRAPLQPSSTKLKLYSGELMESLGLFQTECSIRDCIHKLNFEIVDADQKPLLSGSTCERLGLMLFTIPAELHNVDNQPAKSLTRPLTKQQILHAYSDVYSHVRVR